jgi:hypothetical protein
MLRRFEGKITRNSHKTGVSVCRKPSYLVNISNSANIMYVANELAIILPKKGSKHPINKLSVML